MRPKPASASRAKVSSRASKNSFDTPLERYQNVWPAPSASGLIESAKSSVCVNVSGFAAMPASQDGDSRVLILVRFTASKRRIWYQVFRPPFDCQAIFDSSTRKHERPISASCADRPARYAAEGNPFAANFSPRRKMAQAIRASLLAKATTAIFLWTRASSPFAHRPRAVSRSAR
jgi:hypothetical protein